MANTVTDAVLVKRGSSSAPSITSQTDPDTGIHFPNDSNMAIVLDGQRVLFLRNGAVGMGNKQDPGNAYLYVGNAGGPQSDHPGSDKMGIAIDLGASAGQECPDAIHANLTLKDGCTSDPCIGVLSTIDSYDRQVLVGEDKAALCASWETVIIHGPGPSYRPAWGSNTFVIIEEGVDYKSGAWAQEFNIRNDGLNVNPAGVVLVTASGKTDTRCGIRLSSRGEGGVHEHSIMQLVRFPDQRDKPRKNFISYGPGIASEPKEGEEWFRVDNDGQTSDRLLPLNRTGGPHVLQLEDRRGMVEVDQNVIIPTEVDAKFPIGSRVNIMNVGSGNVDISSAPGVTLRYSSTGSSLSQWQTRTLWKRATNEWVILES